MERETGRGRERQEEGEGGAETVGERYRQTNQEGKRLL